MTAASTSPTPRTATTSSTCRWPIRRACRAPAASPIVEKYSYTREAMSAYMRALKPGGILSVTLWNKEEPPKSVLKLYATMVAAARDVDGRQHRATISTSPRPTSRPRPCSYKRGGFTPEEIAKLNAHTKAMSFDAIYYPGIKVDTADLPQILQDYHDQFFFEGTPADPTAPSEKEPNDKPPPGMTTTGADGKTEVQGRRPAGAARAGHRARPAGLALPDQRRLAEGGRRVRVRHPHPHQPPAVLRRLHQGEGPAEVHRPARAGAGRVGLSAAVGDARHRHHLRPHPGAVPAGLRLAHHLQPLSRQVRHA